MNFVPLPNDFDAALPQEGILRRAAAGIRSLLARGFASTDIFIDPTADENGLTALYWTSSGGVWSARPWSVSAMVTLTPGCVRVQDPTLMVGSAQNAGPKTAYKGRTLRPVLEHRLEEVLQVIGARVTEPNDDLTEEEVEAYHNLHPSPERAFRSPEDGRVVLWDNAYGQGSVVKTADPAEGLLQQLLEAGWAVAQANHKRRLR